MLRNGFRRSLFWFRPCCWWPGFMGRCAKREALLVATSQLKTTKQGSKERFLSSKGPSYLSRERIRIGVSLLRRDRASTVGGNTSLLQQVMACDFCIGVERCHEGPFLGESYALSVLPWAEKPSTSMSARHTCDLRASRLVLEAISGWFKRSTNSKRPSLELPTHF